MDCYSNVNSDFLANMSRKNTTKNIFSYVMNLIKFTLIYVILYLINFLEYIFVFIYRTNWRKTVQNVHYITP